MNRRAPLHALSQAGTHDEKTRAFFKPTKVNAQFVATVGDETNTVLQGTSKQAVFTHHQKFVVCDAPRTDGDEGTAERELRGFVGGVDLTEGRWDNRRHPLFRTLASDHKGDTYSCCFGKIRGSVGPREPWVSGALGVAKSAPARSISALFRRRHRSTTSTARCAARRRSSSS